jgi:hypothetical protein
VADPNVAAVAAEIAKLYGGEPWAYWIQTLILVIGTIGAFLAVWSARVIERRKAASAVIFQARADGTLVDGIRRITQLHDGETNIRKFAKADQKDSEESKAIRYVLNHYEYISVGIQEDIYDEKIFKKSSFSTITKVYERTRPFIEALRVEEKRDTIYQEVEWLACRWLCSPLKKNKIKTQRG